MAELQKAIESDPTSHSAYLELARAYAQRGDFTAAEKVLRDSLEVDPQSVDTRMALGDALAAAGQEAEAGKEYRRVLERDPTQGISYVRLARLNQKQWRLQEAERLYRQWVEVVPNDAGPHVALAQFYWDTVRSMISLWSSSRTFVHGFLVLPAACYLMWCYRPLWIYQIPVPSPLGLGALVLLGVDGSSVPCRYVMASASCGSRDASRTVVGDPGDADRQGLSMASRISLLHASSENLD